MTNHKEMLILEIIFILLILGGVILYLLFNGSSLGDISFITGK